MDALPGVVLSFVLGFGGVVAGDFFGEGPTRSRHRVGDAFFSPARTIAKTRETHVFKSHESHVFKPPESHVFRTRETAVFKSCATRVYKPGETAKIFLIFLACDFAFDGRLCRLRVDCLCGFQRSSPAQHTTPVSKPRTQVCVYARTYRLSEKLVMLKLLVIVMLPLPGGFRRHPLTRSTTI